MNQFVSNRKCLVFCLVSFVVGIATAFGGNDTGNSKFEVPEIVKMQQRSRAARNDRAALEAYEKRDGKIASWVENTAAIKPDNAALLYYQAFLLRPDTNMDMTAKLNAVLRGAESDRQVRTYLGHCLPMIQTTEIASRMPQCTWGIWYGTEAKFDSKELFLEVSNLKNILVVDARTLAADGHYRLALERCLTLRRVAWHLSDSHVSEIVTISWGFDQRALLAAKDILGVMPPDEDILSWFRGQLALVSGVKLSLAEKLHMNLEDYLSEAQAHPTYLTTLRNQIVRRTEAKQAKDTLRNLTDEELVARIRESFAPFFASIFQIADSELTYEQKCAQMQRLVNKLMEGDDVDPLMALVMLSSATDPMYDGNYPLQIRHAALVNGIKTAVEIYLVLGKTSKLPEELPNHLPKDPFTGKDFVYEITDEGFALRCQGESFQGRGKRQLEFKVRR